MMEYIISALKGKFIRFFKKEDGTWAAEKVIRIPPKKVEGWGLPDIEGELAINQISNHIITYSIFCA